MHLDTMRAILNGTNDGRTAMSWLRQTLLCAGTALLVGSAALPAMVASGPAQASEIRFVVNNMAVTSVDVKKRVAFLKLQNRKGDLNKLAGEEMVEQTLKNSEIKRLNIRITDEAVNTSFARFAASNKMSAKQMSGIFDKAGVTASHFKEFIRTQMGWSQAVAARYRAQGGSMSEQDVVKRMLEQGGSKPTATEYMLQQVIFVVPEAERKSALGKRKKEAAAMRERFSGCDTTRQFAKGLIDVTVRDLGRLLAPELPPEWAEEIKKTKTGGATSARETARGVEFIGICSSREVSDDRVAKMVFQSEGKADEQGEELSKKYVAELRERARIVQR